MLSAANSFYKKTLSATLWMYAICMYTSCNIPHYETRPVAIQVEPSPQLISRGKALVSMMCADCHRDPVSKKLTGKHLADVPKIMGTLYAENITRHNENGIGKYTDAELAYLLRSGVDRHGYLSPMMAKPGLSDQDLQAIIAYLKHSPDEVVQPAAVESKKSIYSLPAKMAFRLKLKPFKYPQQPIATPDISDKVTYGKYMVRIMGCYDCHSKNMATVDKLHPEKSRGYMGGGAKLKGLNGENIRTPNITMDTETGIGTWTAQDFVKAIRESVRPDHTVIIYPMPNYGELTQQEAEAIYAYIQSIPALRKKVKRQSINTALPVHITTSDTLAAGMQLYTKYGCKSCHGENGIGIADLRMAYQKYPENAQLKAFIQNPAAFNPDSRMPKFEGLVQETDYAPLLSYVRWLGKNK